MNQQDRVKLRFGPYKTPQFRYGDVVFCERCGEVTLCGLSSGRIPWPTCRRGKAMAIVLFGDLVDAVRRESSVAIQYWWGVGPSTASKWRKALAVERLIKGTRALLSAYASEPQMDAFRAKAWAKAGDPERRAKISAAFRGRRPAPHVIEAAVEANTGRRPTEETRRKMRTAHKRRGTRPPHGRSWTVEEDALVRSLAPREVAKVTGRSMASVWQRRGVLGLPDGRKSRAKRQWTAQEDALIRSLSPKEVARVTGRSLNMIYRRRQELGRERIELPDGRKSNGRVPRSRVEK
jgi:hypothetical protein